jgi:hypothetical protein
MVRVHAGQPRKSVFDAHVATLPRTILISGQDNVAIDDSTSVARHRFQVSLTSFRIESPLNGKFFRKFPTQRAEKSLGEMEKSQSSGSRQRWTA